MKKSAKVLHPFDLDCGMLEFLQLFFSQAVIQRTIVDFPAFLKTGWRNRFRFVYIQPVITPQVGGLDAFLYEAAQNFEVFPNTQN